MATAKQKQHRLIVIETTVLVLVLTATVFYMKIRWNLNESELEMLTFPLVGAMTLLIVGLHFLQKPFLFHENNRFSRLVYQVKVIEEKNTINPQKVARLKDRLVDFAKRNPDFEKEVNRYLGDLTFATMDTEESLRYYTAALAMPWPLGGISQTSKPR